MQIAHLRREQAVAAVELWRDCDLTRPWNDPVADLERALDGPSSTVLAAVDGALLAGTAMVGHDGHRGWVYYLAVRPELRRQRIGGDLMAACERWLDDRDVPKVQLMVRAGNAPVVQFYQSLGYADQAVVVLGRFLDPELQAMRRAGTP